MLESPKLGEKTYSERVNQNEYELTKMSTSWPDNEYELTNWVRIDQNHEYELTKMRTGWLEYELTWVRETGSLHKQSHGTVPHTYRRSLFTTMVNQQLLFVCFFTVKLDATNSFPSNTAEVRHIYLKMGHIMRQSVFVICEQQRRRSACASTQSDHRLCCSLPGYYITRFYSSKLYSLIVSNLPVFGKRLIVNKSKFHAAGRVYTDSVSLYRCFCDKPFW